jgi:hypothetical protein
MEGASSESLRSHSRFTDTDAPVGGVAVVRTVGRAGGTRSLSLSFSLSFLLVRRPVGMRIRNSDKATPHPRHVPGRFRYRKVMRRGPEELPRVTRPVPVPRMDDAGTEDEER